MALIIIQCKINFYRHFTLREDLSENYEKNYLSLALIPAQAADNEQEYLAAI